jgi:2-keto-4-pentenoate hydratase/2-oxohepta-3-ene-1,7-dioic acid hydratase in catechol pathway
MTEIYALGTFTEGSGPRWPGVVRGGKVRPLADLIDGAPADLGALFADWERWSAVVDAAVGEAGAEGWRDEADLVAHLPYKPENLFGAGANYRRHVVQLIVDKGAGGVEHLDAEARRKYGEELMDRRAATGKPFIWVGLRSAIAGPARLLVLPYDMVEPDWELELAVVIGRSARRVPRERALDHIAGYTIANDITARELVWSDTRELGMDLLACKSASGFHILGPYITPARFVADPQALHIRLSLNDRVMQDEGTDDMIFSVARMIEHISMYAELQPGDILMSGSPSGNGTHYNRFLRDGDVMVGEIDGLVGRQVTRCVAEPKPGPA